MDNIIITTTDQPSAQMIAKAKQISDILKRPYVSRGNASLLRLREMTDCGSILQVSRQGLILISGEQRHFFHISMAQLRVQNLDKCQQDYMVSAMNITAGSSVLDCTLGMATDAIVASVVTGGTGKVTGIEVSPVLALLTKEGLASCSVENTAIETAMRRIEVITDDYLHVLETALPKSYDVVYFDPMFRRSIATSSAINPIRQSAEQRPVDKQAIELAKRVARRRVVLKERQGSPEFVRLGFTNIMGGKYSRISYGILEVGDIHE